MEFSQEAVTTLVVQWGTSLALALATLIAGLFVAGVIGRLLGKVLDRAQVDPSLRSFLTSLTSILFKVMVYITALGVLGIEMTSFVAILAAAGLAVGMALSGTLQNFAGGVMILLFKPFKVGDFIEAQGYAG
ncbi:MAG: mechanosensitive ion channel, partial [Gammaproteobacteria bacterium]|nr:mechanosensitive ion channel [Gammaproteobacteria bacterium]